jgi:DNA repair protein RadC
VNGPSIAPRKRRAYRVPVNSVAFVREGTFAAPHPLPAPWAVGDLANRVTESLILMPVDGQGRARTVVMLARGGTHGLGVNVSDILRCALLSGRPGFVLAHNHPSGDATPSSEDAHFTRKIVDACDLVGVTMVDHVIIGDPDICSWHNDPHRWGR